jgi:zinc/manganese transport system substrate-binding protein
VSYLFGFLCLLLVSALPARAALNVVATLPDFGAIAEAVGGDKVKVTSLAKGTEDPHFVDARPSFVRVLNRADVLLEGGAELEVGWLPPLIQGARNRRIQGDAPGHVIMSQGIQLLEVPTTPVTRAGGDVHPAGNPHFWLDPENGRIMAATVAKAFETLDGANAAHYQSRLAAFNRRLDQKIPEWTRIMASHKGTRVVTYHKSFEYLANRFGLVIIGQLEPKPGIEPSPTHINALIPRMKAEGARLILIETFRARRTPEYTANATGAKVVVLPESVGGHEKVRDYFDLFDYAVTQIDSALKSLK